jgi:hypothetical protein
MSERLPFPLDQAACPMRSNTFSTTDQRETTENQPPLVQDESNR